MCLFHVTGVRGPMWWCKTPAATAVVIMAMWCACCALKQQPLPLIMLKCDDRQHSVLQAWCPASMACSQIEMQTFGNVCCWLSTGFFLCIFPACTGPQ